MSRIDVWHFSNIKKIIVFVFMLWINFIPWDEFIFFVSTHYHTLPYPKPRLKLNFHIYIRDVEALNFPSISLFISFVCHRTRVRTIRISFKGCAKNWAKAKKMTGGGGGEHISGSWRLCQLRVQLKFTFVHLFGLERFRGNK